MKFKSLLFLSVFILLLSACKKDKACTQNPVSAEKADMIAFCTANSISYTEHSSGFLYQIITPGTGTVTPNLDSRVFMYYKGTLLNGTQFDAQSDPTKTGWYLKNLIEGWQLGVPLIKKGGRIKLIIPSALAYGCTGQGSIPANSPLFFDLTLTDLQ